MAIFHRRSEDLENEAIQLLVLRQLPITILFNLMIILIITSLNIQDIYIGIVMGTIGFAIWGLIGAFAVFLPVLAIAAYIKLRLGEGVLVKT